MARKVLVADDEPAASGLLRMILEDAGYQVDVAHDGEQALLKVEQGHPDILVLDLMMPRLDGWAVLDRLALLPLEKRPPVIVVSALGCDAPVIARAERAGASRCIGKPFNFRELLAACAEIS
jgi:DNA-binding response OmpR family regulator